MIKKSDCLVWEWKAQTVSKWLPRSWIFHRYSNARGQFSDFKDLVFPWVVPGPGSWSNSRGRLWASQGVIISSDSCLGPATVSGNV